MWRVFFFRVYGLGVGLLGAFLWFRALGFCLEAGSGMKSNPTTLRLNPISKPCTSPSLAPCSGHLWPEPLLSLEMQFAE